MRILFAAIGAYGHVYPLLPLAVAAAEAGHEVRFATGDPFLDRLPVPTIPAYTDLSMEDAVAETRRRHPEAQGVDLSVALFADVTAEYVFPGIVAACETFEPDLVVYEAMMTGAGVAADVLDVPAAAFAIGLARFVYPMLHGATIGHRASAWSDRGRSVPTTPLLARALIDPAPPSFGGVEDVPVIPIRPVAWSDAAAELPAGWAGAAERPRVFLTLGTVSFGAVEVLRRAATEIATLDVDLLVAVGPEGDPAVLDGIEAGSSRAGSITVQRFVPQSRVMPLLDVFVHHGGTGSVLGALATGVPQLVLPQGADQFVNGELLVGLGAARVLQNDQAEPGDVAAAVTALSGDSPERASASRIAAEIAALPAPADVVPRLAELVRR